jgi:hypothetical protein
MPLPSAPKKMGDTLSAKEYGSRRAKKSQEKASASDKSKEASVITIERAPQQAKQTAPAAAPAPRKTPRKKQIHTGIFHTIHTKSRCMDAHSGTESL